MNQLTIGRCIQTTQSIVHLLESIPAQHMTPGVIDVKVMADRRWKLHAKTPMKVLIFFTQQLESGAR